MHFLNLHTHQFTNQESILELVNQYPWEFKEAVTTYSIGIHPWYIRIDRIESDFVIMEQKVVLDSCLAIGECGLDKRIEIPLDLQQSVFERQLLLAQKYNRPVIIHCVAAFQELIDIKKKLNITVPIVVHGFSKNIQLATQLIKNGFYLSFGKYLMRNPELEAVFTAIPNDRFFLETDTSEQTIQEVYTLAAKYKNTSVSELQEIIKTNFDAVFTNRKSN
jgi:TatD DNase family protein